MARAARKLPTPTQRRALRQRAGLSQAALARVLGTTPAAVCRWECGLRHPHGKLAAEYGQLLERLAMEGRP